MDTHKTRLVTALAAMDADFYVDGGHVELWASLTRQIQFQFEPFGPGVGSFKTVAVIDHPEQPTDNATAPNPADRKCYRCDRKMAELRAFDEHKLANWLSNTGLTCLPVPAEYPVFLCHDCEHQE